MALEEKLEKWLESPPNMKRKQLETHKLRQEGTGLWLLEGDTFINWQDNPGSLWIQGPSGAGKSVLGSAVISKLVSDKQLFKDLRNSNPPPAVAFFYFDFKDNEGQAVESALRRIILQLSAQSPHPYSALDKQYQICDGQTLPTYQDLLKLLKELLLELGRTYIVLDALDECKEVDLGQLLDFISVLRSWTQTPLHLLITSQPRSIFREYWRDVSCIVLDSSVTDKDIQLFVTEELQKSAFKGWTSRADYIVERIVRKSNGMFRLAACLLLEISRRWTNVGELDKMLDMLPNDLFGIYDRFLEAVHPEDMVYATGVLRWIIFSSEEMTLSRLADAVGFDFSNPPQYVYEPHRREGNKVAILRWLEGLIIVNSSRVILAHASVQDYLLSKEFAHKFGHNLSTSISHTFIAQTCIHYFLHFSSHPFDATLHDNYPLAQYAADNWCHHLLLCHDRSILFDSAMCLLEDGSRQYEALKHSHQGFPSLLERPLHLSSRRGRTEIVRLLLQHGADTNLEDKVYGSALQAASKHGYPEVVQLLLQAGADVNANKSSLPMLQHHRADVNRTNNETALEAACDAGHTSVVRLLLQAGASMDMEGGFFGGPLNIASKGGHTEMMQLLLDNGADVNAKHKGLHGESALQTACTCNQTEAVRLLLKNDAHVNAMCEGYGSVLQCASRHSTPEIVRLLLENSADVNRMGGKYGSALQAASGKGKTEVMQLLLDHGADVNAAGGEWGSALQAASVKGNPEVVLLLLENGADVNAKGGYYGSALHAASIIGDTELVNLLLKNSVNVNVGGEEYGSALDAASEHGKTEVVQLLLDHGADVNAAGGEWGSALQAASMKGNTETVLLLLEKGADVNAQGNYYGSALHAASIIGDIELVNLLLENGANVNVGGEEYGSALQAASGNGITEVVQLLLDHGADVNAAGGEWGSALQAAYNEGYTQIVDLLLANGAVDTRFGE
ncbi:ankyrin repeat-containing domain protein [Mycena latifolia]|nr:ankyrin repeat-containing domain protein [Mycena latifolia]